MIPGWAEPTESGPLIFFFLSAGPQLLGRILFALFLLLRCIAFFLCIFFFSIPSSLSPAHGRARAKLAGGGRPTRHIIRTSSTADAGRKGAAGGQGPVRELSVGLQWREGGAAAKFMVAAGGGGSGGTGRPGIGAGAD